MVANCARGSTTSGPNTVELPSPVVMPFSSIQQGCLLVVGAGWDVHWTEAGFRVGQANVPGHRVQRRSFVRREVQPEAQDRALDRERAQLATFLYRLHTTPAAWVN